MANDNSANVSQFQLPKDLKLAEDVSVAPLKITGVASESTSLTPQQLTVEVVPPASGTATVVLPPLSTWKDKEALIYSRTSAPGGDVAIKLVENATDPVGDTITATGDKVLLRNVKGDHVVVLIDVTT